MEEFRTLVFILLSVATVVYYIYQLRYDMQMLQQNSYRNERYIKWIKQSDEPSRMPRLVVMATLAMLCAFWFTWTQIVAIVVMAIMLVTLILKKYKKPLVFTNRVWRLFAGCVILSAAILTVIVIYHFQYFSRVVLALTAVSYMIVIAANSMLKPVETAINKSYVDDAKRILMEMPNLKIIGITGSYGKTSTKYYLNRILNEEFNVLMTPGSYNTPMGVVRTIREMLQPYHDIFIVEMGAKNSGDIKEICDIVHPSIGILTAVGKQHLESFKTIENVQRTKFELIDSLPENGMAVLNNDFEYVANRNVDNVRAIRYAIHNINNADYVAESINYSTTGTRFTLRNTTTDQSIEFETHLLGESNISNLMASIIVAMQMDVDVNKIKYAVSKVEQVEHRLSMKHTGSGLTIIDDAFNSNPVGASMALDVIKMMKPGKRIIVTPGMIELGIQQAECNRAFGSKIVTSCDVAIIVGEYNRDDILAGIESVDNYKDNLNVHVADNFAHAQQILHTLIKPGDIVLYENDLPDTFK